MRHLYIINRYSRSTTYGIGSYTKQLTKAVKEIFDQVTVITLLVPNIDAITTSSEGNELEINIPITKSGLLDYSQIYPDRYFRGVFYSLLPFIRTDAYNIFHFNHMNCATLGKILKEKLVCKIVVTIHCMDWCFAYPEDKPQLREVLKNPSDKHAEKIKKIFENEKYFMQNIADEVIAVARHAQMTIQEEYNIEPEKVHLIPHGIPDSFTQKTKQEKGEIRKRYSINKKDKIILFAGRVEPSKGIEHLAELLNHLVKLDPDIRLIIVGEGDLIYTFQLFLSCHTHVSYTGFLPHPQLFELFSIARIGIVPSLHEEFGYVALEMMMSGLPVVVNETSGLKELISDGKNGLRINLFLAEKNEGLYERYAKDIYRLLKEPVRRRTFIKESRKIFKERYQINLFKENMRDFYSHII